MYNSTVKGQINLKSLILRVGVAIHRCLANKTGVVKMQAEAL